MELDIVHSDGVWFKYHTTKGQMGLIHTGPPFKCTPGKTLVFNSYDIKGRAEKEEDKTSHGCDGKGVGGYHSNQDQVKMRLPHRETPGSKNTLPRGYCKGLISPTGP